MTRINFRQVGNHFTAVFTGHAMAKRENGNDLACAAVSALAQTLVQSACEALERGQISKIITLKINPNDGSISLEALATEEGFPHVLGMFSTVASGVALVAESYPDNVSLGRDFQAYSVQCT